jgi:hypothetical protein
MTFEGSTETGVSVSEYYNAIDYLIGDGIARQEDLSHGNDDALPSVTDDELFAAIVRFNDLFRNASPAANLSSIAAKPETP